MFVSTQATKDAADVFMPPMPDQVAFGDALLMASDVVISMCMIEDESDKRLLAFQKYRDGVMPLNTAILDWKVNNGYIAEAPDDF